MSFTNGQRVEVVHIEQGLEDSLFAAKILPLPKKRKRGTKIFYVEYDNFFDDKGTKKLREYVDFTRLRPLPPQDLHSTRAFQVSEEVDVSWNDAWWKGVITKAHNGGLTYSVFFEHTLEEFEYDRADLRTHHDWLDGNWVRSKIQITSSDCLETALPKEEEETRGFPNQTGESARASDMSTPQSSSGAIDIVVENTMPSSSNVCEMIDNSSDTKRIHSSYGSVVSEQHIFKKVRDRLTKKVPIVLHACDSRKRSSKALDVFAFPTRDCQRNFTEGEQDASLCRSRGQSHEEHHTVLPMGQTKEDVCSSGIKLVGVGRFENQTEVLETEHLKDFGEKTKRTKGEARTVCTSQDTAAWWKLFWHFEGDENECSANEIPDSQRESTPLPIQAAEDSYLILQSTPIPGLDPESAARENEVVDKVCEEHQHLSVVPESLVLPDSGGIPLDNQLMSTERDGSTERLVSSEKSNPVEGPSFIKKVWEIIESIQVLKSIPQHPHFGPLKHENDLHREGYIIGHMLNFANLAEKLKRAKLEQPRSKFEDISNAVSDFEKLGFTVHPFQTHLEELLALKDSYSQLEESSKSAKDEFIAAKSKSDELQESINSVKMKLKRDMTEMEMKASKLAERQGTLDEIKQQLQIAKLDFDTAVQAPF